MKKLFALALCVASFAVQADTCDELRAVAKMVQKDAGTMVDNVTRLDTMAVLCGTKAIVYAKTVFVDSSKMKPGWEQRIQEQWNQLQCQEPAIKELIDNGWEVSQRAVFQPENRVVIHYASCK